MKDSISIFRELCSKFENLVRVKYNLDDNEKTFRHFLLQKENKKFKEDMQVIRNIRNLISHVECKIEGKAAIEINENIIEKFKEIISYLRRNFAIFTIF